MNTYRQGPECDSNEDRRWVCSCRDGNDRAFENLVRKYQQYLFNIVYRHIGDPAEVEDIVQKIVSKAYFALEQFDPDRPFFPWLYRIAMNQCYDELRRIRRRRTVRFADLHPRETRSLEAFLSRSRMKPPPEEDAKGLHSLLYRMLDRLSQKQRKALVLRDLEQVPYEKIAELLNCSEQAARLKVMRARARLRDLMIRALRRRRLHAAFREPLPHTAPTLTAPGTVPSGSIM